MTNDVFEEQASTSRDLSPMQSWINALICLLISVTHPDIVLATDLCGEDADSQMQISKTV